MGDWRILTAEQLLEQQFKEQQEAAQKGEKELAVVRLAHQRQWDIRRGGYPRTTKEEEDG